MKEAKWEKVMYYMIPTVWLSEKESKKNSGYQGFRDEGRKGGIVRAQGIFRAVKLSCIYCNGGYISLYILQNLYNEQHKEWTLT